MNGASAATASDTALLKPRQSLQNIGETKKDDDKRHAPRFEAFGADGFTFLDFLDIVNPLQHIPIVSSLYREMTGDEIDPGSRIAGGILFGGPIGAVAASVNVVLNENTGKDMSDHVVAFLRGEEATASKPVELASSAADSGLETAAGPSAGVELAGLSQLSPIAANLEVLEWAKRESALMVGTPTPAAAETPDIKPVADMLSQAVDNKKAPGKATSDGPGKQHKAAPYAIAVNTEVVDWARAESRLTGTARHIEAQTRDLERNTVLDAARDKAVASGLTPEQLSGATAPSGGWFSETMLLALARYQDSAGLGRSGASANAAARDTGALDLNLKD